MVVSRQCMRLIGYVSTTELTDALSEARRKPGITSLSKVSLFEVYFSIGNIFSQGESRYVISLQSTVYES